MENLFWAIVAVLLDWQFWAGVMFFLVLNIIVNLPDKIKDLHTLTLENNVRLRHLESILSQSDKDPS